MDVRRLSVLLCALAAVLLALPAGASATRPLTTGLGDIPGKWGFDQAANANVKIVKMPLSWASVVGGRPPDRPGDPSDHSYHWNQVDDFVNDASDRGLQVMFNLTRAPTWAEGPGSDQARYDGTWKPDPAAFGAFAHAVARRYSGNYRSHPGKVALPRVRYFGVWAEANRTPSLEPQWEHGKPASPEIYRRLANSAYAAIHSVHTDNKVIGPALAPYGDPRKHPADAGPRMRPVYFLRQLFCLTDTKKLKRKKSCPPPVKLDVLAHNPINSSGSPSQHATNPDDASSADLDRITRVGRAAEHAGTLLPNVHHQLWATETWWESKPPSGRGVPPPEQARRIIQALFIYWRDGARVVIQQPLRDGMGKVSGFGGGLFFANGKPKPAYRAFRFPFLTKRKSKRKIVAWGKAPTAGKLLIQRQKGKRWKTITHLSVHDDQVFKKSLKLRGKAKFRAKMGSTRSLVWKQKK